MDEVISGSRVGDEVDMLLRAEDAFGAHDPSLTCTDKLADVPPGFRFVGAEVPMQNASGDGQPTVDGNHPAGKSPRVHIRVQGVRDPTPDELAQDRPSGSIPNGGLH